MSQLIIVTTPQNSGLGTPLATAFDYTNQNFGELYARAQPSPPATLIGQEGDVPGMYAYDSTYFYYCFANYNGTSTIWAQVTQVANVALAEIQSGSSNVAIVGPSANVTVGINGTSNVAVFATTGIYASGLISAVGNIRGSYILGNGSQLTGLPATYTNANVIALLGSYSDNIVSSANISGGNLTATGAVTGSSITTTSNGVIITTGNIVGNTVTTLGGYIESAGGLQATGIYNGSFSDGIVIDYQSGNGRISVGNADGINFYNGGIGDTLLASLDTTGVFTANADISALGNIVGANLTTLGNVISQGIVSATGDIITDGYFVGTFVGNVTGNFVIPGANTQVVFNTNGNADAVGGFTYNTDSNTMIVLGVVSAQGNVKGGNITTAGQVSAAGVITAAGNITGANLVAIENIYAANIFNSGSIVTVGNVNATNINGSGNIVATNNLSALGQVIATGNISGGNVSATTYTGTDIAVTGNISGGNLSVSGNVTGTLATASQPNITTVGTLGSLSVTANVRGGNITTAGQVSATGNITGNNLTIGNVNAGANIVANVFLAATASMSGNITGGNILSGGFISVAGTITSAGNITGNYILGNGSQLSGLPVSYTNANVVSLLATFGSNTISTTGNITAGSFNTIGSVVAGVGVSAVGNVDVGGNLNGGISSTFLITNTQNATAVDTGALQIAGGASIGKDLWVIGNIYAGNIQSVTANVLTVETPLLYLYSATTYPYNYDIGFYSHFTGGPGNTYQHTGFVRDDSDNTWKLFSNVAEPTFGVVPFNANTVYDALQTGSITSIGTISATGTISGSGLSAGTGTVTLGSITNGNGNGVGNIGSSGGYFNTVFAKATSAQYADLAEIYTADADYDCGTVVVFGGEEEITTTDQFADVRVAGAISTEPAYVMNTAHPGLPVALRGRIPVKVVGPVNKGDLLVTAGANPGYAVSVGTSTDHPLAVFAKSIETNTAEGEKIITAVIL